MKKMLLIFFTLLMVAGPAANAFAEYMETNENNIIDWYNVIEGVVERDYRSVSSSSHTPFHFSFNGFLAEEGTSYEMTLRHAGNRDNDREQWDLYLEGDSGRLQLDNLGYSNDWNGSDWFWVEQTFLVAAGDLATVGDNWSFVLEPGTDDYNVIDLDKADISAVPLPAALWLLGSGLLGVVGLRKRNQGDK